jgi:DeoR family fructose operon transcriptional repressor
MDNLLNSENNNLFAEERRNKISALINMKYKVTVPELASQFNVSHGTIRNDLRELENYGLLKRTHGGAISNQKIAFEPDSSQKETTDIKEKKAIASVALDFIDDGDVIALDTGTTVLELAKLLHLKKNLKIIIYDIKIAEVLERTSDAMIIMVGGILRKNYQSLLGSMTVNNLKSLNVDKCFIACNALHLKKGVMTTILELAQVKRILIDFSDETILLCTSKKFNKTSLVKYCELKEIQTIITDNKVNDNDVCELRKMGIDVEIAKTY